MKRNMFQLIRLFSFIKLCVLLHATKTMTTITVGTCKSEVSLPAEARSQNFLSPAFVRDEYKSLVVRGGSDSESDGYDEEDEDDEVSSPEMLGQAIELSKKSIALVGKITKNVTIQAFRAIQRAIKAGLEGENDEEEQGLVTKVINSLTRMIKAALTLEGDGEVQASDVDDDDDIEAEDEDKSEVSTRRNADFGTFLSNSYDIKDSRTEDAPQFLGGSLASALETARSQGRMLVVFLPCKRQSKGKKTKEQLAIESLLSAEVAEAANKRARKKGGDSGSFLFWGAKVGSSESTAAIKRLKTKTTSQKGEKRPVLAVVYPAQVRAVTFCHFSSMLYSLFHKSDFHLSRRQFLPEESKLFQKFLLSTTVAHPLQKH